MKRVCLISPNFAFPVSEREIYFPHRRLASALYEQGIRATIICLGPESQWDLNFASVHSVPATQSPSRMLNSWLPTNAYYLSAATSLWQKYLSVSETCNFDVVDVPAYLPINAAELKDGTALVVRSYEHVDGPTQSNQSYHVDRMMLHQMQSASLLQANTVLVDATADAQSNRWSAKLQETFTIPLMSELESCVFIGDPAILPKNDLATIVLGSSACDVAWSVACLDAARQYLKCNANVRFIMPVFQRDLTAEESDRIAAIKDDLSQTGKLDRFYLIRPLAINKMVGCMQSADMVIAANRDSGLPSIALEALAAGKPVLVNRNSALSTFVDMHNCGLVASADTETLISAFDHVLSNGEAFGKKARQSATQLFDLYRDRLMDSYQRACQIAGESANHCGADGAAQQPSLPMQNIPSQQDLLSSWDRLLYDIHYRSSLRFRMKHWVERFSQHKRRASKKPH